MIRTRSANSAECELGIGTKKYRYPGQTVWQTSAKQAAKSYLPHSSVMTDRIKEGRRDHPCSVSTTEKTCLPFYAEFTAIGREWKFDGWRYEYWASHPSGSIDTTEQARIQNACKEACIPKIRPTASVLVDVAQAASLRGLVKSVARPDTIRQIQASLTKAKSPLRRSEKDVFRERCRAKGYSRSSVKAYLKAMANDYLCYSFGFLPLVDTIAGIKEALDARIAYRAKRSFMGLQHAEGVSSASSRKVSTPSFGGEAATVTKYRAKAEIVFRWTNRPIPGLDDSQYWVQSLGLMSIGSAIWDCIPFSFMVNWFIPVNKLIESVEGLIASPFQPNFTVVSGTLQTWSDVMTTIKWNGGISSDQPKVPVGRTHTKKYERVLLSSLEVINPSFRATGLNGKKASYMVACALQRA